MMRAKLQETKGNSSTRAPWARLLSMIRRDPGAGWSLGYYHFQTGLGFRLNRRLVPSWSLPPSYISLNPTRRCNLKCRMCIQHRHLPLRPPELSWYDPERELPLKAWIQLLEELAGWRPVIFITGGEPLLYPQLLPLIEEAKKRHLVVHLQTNGLLLEKVAADIVALGVEMVTVSLDGPPAIHELIRGKGTFAPSARGLATLAEIRGRRQSPGPVLDIRCTISRDNVGYLAEMVEVALELGADTLQFTHTIFSTPELVARHNRLVSPAFAAKHGLTVIQPSIPPGEYYESGIDARLLPVLRHDLEQLREKAKNRLWINFSPGLPPHLVEPYYLDLDYPFPQICRSLWRSCRILPDGTVSPCLHVVMGNILQEPLRRIWNNSRMQNFRRLISRRLLPGCVRCCHRVYA